MDHSSLRFSYKVVLDTVNSFLSRILSGPLQVLPKTTLPRKLSRLEALLRPQADLGRMSKRTPSTITGGRWTGRFQEVEMLISASTGLMLCAIIACPWSRMTGNTTKTIISNTFPITPTFANSHQRLPPPLPPHYHHW